MTSKTPETARIVYCWQYIHSLDFFSRMLSQHVGHKSSPLQPLVYPVIQVALGVIKLNPSSQFFGLRFRVVESLMRLARQTGVYIPLAPTLLEILDASIMKVSSKGKKDSAVLKPVDLDITLRVSASYLTGLTSRVYRDQVALKMVDLLAQFFDLHGNSPAFPELVLTPTIILKKWIKKYGGECGGKVRRALADLVERLDAQAKWVEERRKGMEFDPDKLRDFQVVSEKEEGPLRKWVQKQKTMNG
jgi:nucleolar complex protein 2